MPFLFRNYSVLSIEKFPNMWVKVIVSTTIPEICNVQYVNYFSNCMKKYSGHRCAVPVQVNIIVLRKAYSSLDHSIDK